MTRRRRSAKVIVPSCWVDAAEVADGVRSVIFIRMTAPAAGLTSAKQSAPAASARAKTNARIASSAYRVFVGSSAASTLPTESAGSAMSAVADKVRMAISVPGL
jgi:hypothetical protein